MQCYGDSYATDYIARVKAKEQQTVNTSNGIMAEWNKSGGNTSFVSKTAPTFMQSVGNMFDKVIGILGAPAYPGSTVSNVRKPVIAPSTPVPIAAFAAVGALAFVLYKAVK